MALPQNRRKRTQAALVERTLGGLPGVLELSKDVMWHSRGLPAEPEARQPATPSPPLRLPPPPPPL